MERARRIIIVDDDRHTRAGLRAFLGTYQLCAVVGEARNGAEAIAAIERCQPDALLLDLQMPVLDGLRATRIIKHRWPAIAIVALSVDAGQRSAALRAGADAFVSKLDAPCHLVAVLQGVCA
jgi:DNA-binding NarL/FixJ family response regulator